MQFIIKKKNSQIFGYLGIVKYIILQFSITEHVRIHQLCTLTLYKCNIYSANFKLKYEKISFKFIKQCFYYCCFIAAADAGSKQILMLKRLNKIV